MLRRAHFRLKLFRFCDRISGSGSQNSTRRAGRYARRLYRLRRGCRVSEKAQIGPFAVDRHEAFVSDRTRYHILTVVLHMHWKRK